MVVVAPQTKKFSRVFLKLAETPIKKTHYEITDRVCVCECGCVRVCVRTCHAWVRLHKFPRKQKKLLCWLPQLESLSISIQLPTYPPLSLSLSVSLLLPGTIWSTSNRSYALSHNVCTHTRCECGVAVYFAYVYTLQWSLVIGKGSYSVGGMSQRT